MKEWTYRGRWGLVTGASAGLGAEFAEQLAFRGMPLVLAARRRDRLEEIAARLRRAYGVEVEVREVDLEKSGEARRLWRAVSEQHPIDLLVNNAGFGAQGRFDEIDLERQVEMVRVNCASLLELAHDALGSMRRRGGGGIINVASVAGHLPVPNMATYAATKAFVLSLSQALWAENRDAGIRVVALSPGRTPTEFQEIAGSGDPRGSFGVRTPRQVVHAALRALERGAVEVVPGATNRGATLIGRLTPRGILLRLLGPVIRRRASR